MSVSFVEFQFNVIKVNDEVVGDFQLFKVPLQTASVCRKKFTSDI